MFPLFLHYTEGRVRCQELFLSWGIIHKYPRVYQAWAGDIRICV